MTLSIQTRDWSRRLAASLAAALLSACSVQAGERCAELRAIAGDVDGRSLPPIVAETLALATSELPALGLTSCVVTVLGSVPPYSLVYLEDPGGAWALSIKDGSPTGGADGLVLKALHRSAPVAHELELAREITMALIDPDPNTAVVLESRASIPIDRAASDALRDLKAQGLEPAAIEVLLLNGAPPNIAPPRFQLDSTGRRVLAFYVWRFFGGGILRVSAPMESTEDAKIHIEAVATRVGSWDFRM